MTDPRTLAQVQAQDEAKSERIRELNGEVADLKRSLEAAQAAVDQLMSDLGDLTITAIREQDRLRARIPDPNDLGSACWHIEQTARGWPAMAKVAVRLRATLGAKP